MKAVYLDHYIQPKDLQIKSVDQPEPKKDEVLIRVKAFSVNDFDWALIRGLPRAYRLFLGLSKPKFKIPGVDVAGVVEKIGANVSAFKPGDEVFGDLSDAGFGAFAEFVSPVASAVRLKPKNLSFEEAAALPHASALAYQGLFDLGHVERGQKVLINGAGGGVGTLGVQMLKQLEVEVTGVDSDMKLETMKNSGFHHVVDYKKDDFTRGGEKYDLILDAKTTRSPGKYARVLKKGGKYITVGGDLSRLVQIAIAGALMRRATGKTLKVLALKPNEGLDKVSEMCERGELRPVIDGPHEFSSIGALVEKFGRGEHLGKVVVRVS